MLNGMSIFPLTLQRGVRRGVKNVVREPGWGTALGSLLGVLFLGQILLLLVFATEGGLKLLQEQTDLRLEILATATDAQIQDLYQNVRQLPYVGDAVYITREQAYEREQKRDPDLIAFLTKFGIENPFPETMGVRLKKLTDYPQFVKFLQQPVFTKVVNPTFLSQTTDQQQQVYAMIEAIRAGEIILYFVVAILVVAILFVVVELVRRRALNKREELFIEQLVGAGRATILIPFGTEMACLLGAALLLSVLFAAAVILLLPSFLPALGATGLFGSWSVITATLLTQSLGWLLPFELLAVLTLSAFGTVLALRSHVASHTLPLLKSE